MDRSELAALVEQPARVLIIDEDRSMRLIMRYMLEQEAYQVLEAEEAGQGVSTCRESDPDIVIMRGGLEGIEACAAIRASPGREETPILMVTDSDDEEMATQAIDAGALDFIHTPVNWAVLRQRLRRLLVGRRAEQTARYLAYHDTLTGLPNRTLFHDRVKQTLALAGRDRRQFAIIFLDLDRFKLVNETLGHDAGDLLLRTMADRLVESLRGTDTVARVSGDEFVILLRGSEGTLGFGIAARRLLSAVTRPVLIGGQEVLVGASVGLAIYPTHGRDVATLLRNADTALRQVKEQGKKNGVQLYSADMGEKALARICLESSLRRAIENEEFLLNFQPIVESATGRTVRAEALVRWQHPDIGLVPPDQFIPLAEETGDIHVLGEWVLARACADCKQWQDVARGVRVSVNVSGRQFGAVDFVKVVRRVLKHTKLSPHLLEVELTENVVMHDTERSIGMVHELKREGIGVSVDDFGTGHSSLACLRRLPLNALKIDRSFVSHVPADPDDSAIVDAIAAMAHRLRLGVVAEGVESAEQADYLRQIGCEYLQGYLFSRPLPVEQLRVYLEHHAKPDPSAKSTEVIVVA